MGLGTAFLFVGETASGLSRETETSRISPGASKGLRTIHQTANAAIPQTASANAIAAGYRFVISGPVTWGGSTSTDELSQEESASK